MRRVRLLAMAIRGLDVDASSLEDELKFYVWGIETVDLFPSCQRLYKSVEANTETDFEELKGDYELIGR